MSESTIPDGSERPQRSLSFDFRAAANPGTNEQLTDFYQSAEKLAQGLGLGESRDALLFVNNPVLFKVFWDQLVRDYIEPEHATHNGRHPMGVKFKTVMEYIRHEEAHNLMRYSHPIPDKSDWRGIDYICHFMYHVTRVNTHHLSGILYGKGYSERKNYWYMWQCQRFKKQEFTRSRPTREKQSQEEHKTQAESTTSGPVTTATAVRATTTFPPTIAKSTSRKPITLGSSTPQPELPKSESEEYGANSSPSTRERQPKIIPDPEIKILDEDKTSGSGGKLEERGPELRDVEGEEDLGGECLEGAGRGGGLDKKDQVGLSRLDKEQNTLFEKGSDTPLSRLDNSKKRPAVTTPELAVTKRVKSDTMGLISDNS